MKQPINEIKRMQLLAGVITESEYSESKMDEAKNKKIPTNELITLLNKAIQVAKNNIKNADNFDLEDLSQVLESYVDDLKEIGDFEKFDDEDLSESEYQESQVNEISNAQKKIEQYIKDGSEGDLDLSDTKITQLPDNLKVGGSLILRNTPITTLPSNLSVKGHLDLDDTKITQLPDNLKIGGSLYLSDTPITQLPNNLKIYGSLNLNRTKITSLPSNLNINGYLGLRDTPITSLPSNLSVGIDLDLRGTKITSLPSDLKVGDELNFRNTPASKKYKKYDKEEIRKMVAKVGGEIYF